MRQLDFKRIHYLLCCLLSFLIPFPFFFAPIVIILISAAWLLSGNWREGLRELKKSPVLLAWILFFVLHIVSYYFSTDKTVAGFDLEKKLSFAVLPLVLSGSFYRNDARFARLLFSFIAGLSIIALWCLARAAYLFFADGQSAHFFYHALSQGTEANAVYLSWYVITALTLLLHVPWQRYLPSFSAGWRRALLALLSVFLILLSSRLLLVVFVLLLLFTVYRHWQLQNKKSNVATTVIILIGVLLLGLVAFTKNPVSKRFHEVLNKNIDQSFYPDYRQRDQHFNNLTLRVFLWRVGIDNLRQHKLWLFGTGIGDVRSYQDRRMDELGIDNIYNKEYPSDIAGISLHNMYIQSLVALGLPGLIMICYLIGWPLGVRRRWPERTAFFIIMGVSALFMFQESALQTQAGVVYYVFFSVIFYFRYKAVKNTGY